MRDAHSIINGIKFMYVRTRNDAINQTDDPRTISGTRGIPNVPKVICIFSYRAIWENLFRRFA